MSPGRELLKNTILTTPPIRDSICGTKEVFMGVFLVVLADPSRRDCDKVELLKAITDAGCRIRVEFSALPGVYIVVAEDKWHVRNIPALARPKARVYDRLEEERVHDLIEDNIAISEAVTHWLAMCERAEHVFRQRKLNSSYD